MEKAATVVFAKVPGLNIAKSRIASIYGKKRAETIYRELLDKTASNVSGLDYHVTFTGSEIPGDLKSFFFDAKTFFHQDGTSLGVRLHNAFMHLFNHGYVSVVAIGCDCPFADQHTITTAHRYIQTGYDIAIGPAEDGGYYLIGTSIGGVRIFEATQWGLPDLFNETKQLAKAYSLSYHLLPTTYDIDTMEDYKRWKYYTEGLKQTKR